MLTLGCTPVKFFARHAVENITYYSRTTLLPYRSSYLQDCDMHGGAFHAQIRTVNDDTNDVCPYLAAALGTPKRESRAPPKRADSHCFFYASFTVAHDEALVSVNKNESVCVPLNFMRDLSARVRTGNGVLVKHHAECLTRYECGQFEWECIVVLSNTSPHIIAVQFHDLLAAVVFDMPHVLFAYTYLEQEVSVRDASAVFARAVHKICAENALEKCPVKLA